MHNSVDKSDFILYTQFTVLIINTSITQEIACNLEVKNHRLYGIN